MATTFAIINQSTKLDAATVESLPSMAGALAHDLTDNFAPDWNPGMECWVVIGETPGAIPCYLVDSVPSPGSDGFHDSDKGGCAITIEIPALPPGMLSVVLNHEMKESIANAYTNLWVFGPWKSPCWHEVCDPVEDQIYDVDGFTMSNHVKPSWFIDDALAPYDYLGQLTAPFQLTPGGYMGLADTSSVWGSEARAALPPKPACSRSSRIMAAVKARVGPAGSSGRASPEGKGSL